MKKMTKYLGLSLGMLALVALVQPAEASCGSPGPLASAGYIITPNSPYASGGSGPSVTANVGAFFWAVGSGNPDVGAGNDSGSVIPLTTTYTTPGILYSSYGAYPASIFVGWEQAGVDGCVLLGANRCTAVFLTDQDPMTGDPVFAILSDEGSGTNAYDYPGLTMAVAPKLAITGSSRAGTVVTLNVDDPDLSGGLHLDSAASCGGGLNGIIAGYRVCWIIQSSGGMPPSDFARGSWTCGDAEAFDDSGASVSFDCGDADNDAYLTWTLDTDSGFTMPTVSQGSTRIECGSNIAEPEQRIRVAPTNREKPRSRTRGR